MLFEVLVALPFGVPPHPREHYERKLQELSGLIGNDTSINMTIGYWRHSTDEIVTAPASMAGLSEHFNATILTATVQMVTNIVSDDMPAPPIEPPPPPPAPPQNPEGATVLEAGFVAACPAGQMSGASGDCVVCPSGSYCVGGSAFPCERGTWHELIGSNSPENCTRCPSEGSTCNSDVVEILPGYFMWSKYDGASYPCAQVAACKGGTQFGNESCAEGHTGVLCGRCKENFYRGRWSCLPCDAVGQDDEMDAGVGMAIFFPLIAMTFTLFVLFYLRALNLDPKYAQTVSSWLGGSSGGRGLKRQYERFNAWLRPLIPIASGLFKSILSYSQCLSAVRRFEQVVWPPMFEEFMTVFEIADLELFSVVPAECLGRTRLGYPMELYATLSFPIMVFTIPFVMLWTLALFRTRRRKKAWERACEQYSHSRSY